MARKEKIEMRRCRGECKKEYPITFFYKRGENGTRRKECKDCYQEMRYLRRQKKDFQLKKVYPQFEVEFPLNDTDFHAFCGSCDHAENCRGRVRLKLWLNCEIPDKTDLLRLGDEHTRDHERLLGAMFNAIMIKHHEIREDLIIPIGAK